ncbi:MAG: cobalt-precorrin-6A reductase [Actinomycetota bacterium]|nr:cobalt-precorrin-6A reductase [Actinomycetota bacterium]MDA8314111.1 cobalt-precorrin-6A reductase [Actinomycetota bacterium]
MTTPLRVLLLGGTTEASGLAEALSARDDVSVVTSLAGRTAAPTALPGHRRIGGFGGPGGLVAYLRSERITAVVDATHPFAEAMHQEAYDACREAGVPRLRLERPRWQAQGGDRWTVVADVAAAAAAISAGPARRVFLTTGRGDLAAFVPGVDGQRWWLVRSIDPPTRLPLHPAEVILSRGPFSVEGEAELMELHRIDLVVTKNSGGDATVAKLHAARHLDVAVLVIDRPPSPPGPSAATVSDALEWLWASLGLRPADEGRPRPALRNGWRLRRRPPRRLDR